MPAARRVLLGLVSLSVVLVAPAAADACTITWTGSTGNGQWGAAGNWSPLRVPAGTDEVCLANAGLAPAVEHDSGDDTVVSVSGAKPLVVTGGTLAVTDATPEGAVTRLDQRAGEVGGAGRLDVVDLILSGGTQRGPGATIVSRSLDLSGFVNLDGRVLRNEGAATWGGVQSTQLGLFGDSRVVNAGTFAVSNPSASFFDAGGLIANTGTWTDERPDEHAYSPAFENDGTLVATAGDLQLVAGDGPQTTSGRFAAAAPGRITLAGGTFELVAGAQIAGPLTLGGGTLDLQANLTTPAATSLEQTAGTLMGAGNLTVPGTLVWSGGIQTGPGLTTTTGQLQLSGFVNLDGRVLRNEGAATWGGVQSTQLGLFGDSRVVNAGTFAVSNPSASFFDAGGLIANTGTWTDERPDEHAYSPAFENDGTLVATAGDLQLVAGDGPQTTSGRFAAAAPGRITLAGGTFELVAGAQIAGPLTLGGGTLDLQANLTTPAATSLEQTAGTLMGAGNLTVPGTLVWSGGIQTGPGLTTTTGQLQLSGFVNLDGRVLRNEGAATWGGVQSTQLGLFGDSRVVNAGTFAVSNPSASFFDAGGLIANTGTWTDERPDEHAYSPAFENDGTLVATAGDLQLVAGDGPQTTSGRFAAAAPGRITLAGGTFELVAGAQIAGPLTLGGGTLDLQANLTTPAATSLEQTAGTLMGAGNLTVPGTLVWSGGIQTGPGLTTTTGQLQLSGFVNLDGRVLRNEGAATWGGVQSTQLGLFGDSRVVNAGTFAVSNPSASFFDAGGLIANTGTWTDERPDEHAYSPAFENDGTLVATAGDLQLVAGDGPQTTSGRFAAAAPGRITLAGGTFELVAGAQIAGPLTLGGGTLDLQANLTTPAATSLEQTAGTLMGAGNLTVPGTLVWSGGIQTGPGLTTTTGQLQLSGFVNLDGRVLRNEGAATWGGVQSSQLGLAGDWRIENAGTFEITNGNARVGAAGTGVFLNLGRFTSNPSAPDADIPLAWRFENDGVVSARRGRLRFADGYLQSSDGVLDATIAGTQATQDFGIVAVNNLARLAGTLRVRFAGGFLPVAGQTFRLVEAPARSGDLSRLDAPVVPGVTLSAQHDVTGVLLRAAGPAARVEENAVTTAARPDTADRAETAKATPPPVPDDQGGTDPPAAEDARALPSSAVRTTRVRAVAGEVLRVAPADGPLRASRDRALRLRVVQRAPGAANVRVNRRTGALRWRAPARNESPVWLDVVAVDGDGRRSAAVRVTIRVSARR